MCGILGFTGKKNQTLSKKLADLIKHRGYDDQSINYSTGVNFAMNRLAINDLTGGIYPMRFKHLELIIMGKYITISN